VHLPDTLTWMGDDVFNGCIGLESFIVPDSVTQLSEGAFRNCKNLKTVKLSNNQTQLVEDTFNGCESLESVTVPGGVERVRSNAFYGCKNLTSVVLEEGVKEIQESAFEGCPKLKSITIPRSVTKIGHTDAYDDGTIPKGVTICGYRYSYAHTYAKQFGIKFKELDKDPERIPNTIKVKQKYSFKVNKKKARSFSLKASANGAKLSYHSNTEKVTVNSKGKVTIAKGFKGTAVITVSSERTSKYKPANAKVRVVVK
jgi:hypothetical protein